MARGIPSKVIRHFGSVPLFGSVSRSGLRSIVSAATEFDVPAGKILVQEGGFDRDLFVILSGTADVFQRGTRIATMGEGEFFGELALLLKAPRSATVTARTEMTVMVLGWRQLDAILDREPALRRPLLAALAERVRAGDSRSTI